MRVVLILCAMAVLLGAQQGSTSVQVTRDLNGNPVYGPEITQTRSTSGMERTEKIQSINGRTVPVERVEERVLKDDASGRLVERIVRRFDQTGNPSPPEKTVIEEQKQPAGTTVRVTTYRGDLNGNMALAQRSVTETHKDATSQTSETVVEKPTLNGSLEAVEKSSVARTGSGDSYAENAVTYRKGENGFYEALRLVTDHAVKSGQVTESTAEYEVGSSGTLELHGQTVTRTSKRPDGSEVSEVDIFGKYVPGVVDAPGSGLKLKEREVVERRPGSGGSLVETVSVQRPTVTDPGVLGPAKVISETICRGKCQ